MRKLLFSMVVFCAGPMVLADSPVVSLFDGETLQGWRGRSDLWTVQEGAIVGTTTDENPIEGNTFLISEQDIPANFELTAKFQILGGNSGIQYRSKVVDEKKFVCAGYQADIDFSLQFAGINYEEKGRGILAMRGERVTIGDDGSQQKERFGDTDEIGKVIKPGEWNEFRVVANGYTLQHYINGTLTSEVIDNEPAKSSADGVLSLQLHQGPAMVVKFKDLQIHEIVK